MNPEPPPASWLRRVMIGLAVAATVFGWVSMTIISRTDPWYRNTDMNLHNLVDALAINADVRPNPFAQPAIPLKYLLALDFRVRHEVGALPVWNLNRLGRRPDPLQEFSTLVHVERIHSRVLVILLIFGAAGLAYVTTRKIESACFTVILLCGCTGLLFQGLLIRPELLCVGLGNVLALWCVQRAVTTSAWARNHLWLFLAGSLVGLATLEKLPGVCYLGLCYGWCWLAALTPPQGSKAEPGPAPFWGGLLPAAGGATVFVLLLQLREFHETLGPVATSRLRLGGLIVALLPLLGLWSSSRRGWGFLQARLRELVLLGGGFLASLFVAYLLIRGVMSHSHAADYFASALQFVVDPAPHMRELMDTKAETGGLFTAFVNRGPLLFIAATAVAVALFFVRSVPMRLTAFVALLWTGAVGMVVIMSKRHYSTQYDVLSQVPFLLVLALGLSALATAPRPPWRKARTWAAGLAVAAACFLVLTSCSRLRPIYYHYQNDVDPLNGFTVTFLFDHDAHPAAYLKMMRDHYVDRPHFAAALERYLADPLHRY